MAKSKEKEALSYLSSRILQHQDVNDELYEYSNISEVINQRIHEICSLPKIIESTIQLSHILSFYLVIGLSFLVCFSPALRYDGSQISVAIGLVYQWAICAQIYQLEDSTCPKDVTHRFMKYWIMFAIISAAEQILSYINFFWFLKEGYYIIIKFVVLGRLLPDSDGSEYVCNYIIQSVYPKAINFDYNDTDSPRGNKYEMLKEIQNLKQKKSGGHVKRVKKKVHFSC